MSLSPGPGGALLRAMITGSEETGGGGRGVVRRLRMIAPLLVPSFP